MRQRQAASADPSVRPPSKLSAAYHKYKKALFSGTVAILLIFSATGGYLVGAQAPASEAVPSDLSSIASFENRVAESEIICAEVERLNIKAELDTQVALNEALAGTIESRDKEMDDLETEILKSLMANLSEKAISRSGATADNYIKEAKNLLDLSKKLSRFKKTEVAGKVDLSEYEKTLQKRLANIPTQKPISGGLDGYGWRIHPVYRYKQFHGAVDMGSKTGTPIKAAGGGKVIAASYDSRSGNYVKISHGNGFVTAYLHCSKLNVQVGQTVTKGQVVALVGNTGTSTAPHLHFSIEFHDEPINPARIIMG